MMEQLGLADGDRVDIALMNATGTHRDPVVALPTAACLRLRWEHSSQYDRAWSLPDSEAFALQSALERTIDEDYPVLMLNDIVRFSYSGDVYDLRVTGLQKQPPPLPASGD